MKRLLIIPMQSISDVVTNSSSEVFILNTDKTCEEVNTILSSFTFGFEFPEVFDLKKYREWRKSYRADSILDSGMYPGTIFEIANSWLMDSEDEEDVFEFRKDELFDPTHVVKIGNLEFTAHGGGYYDEIHEEFVKYLNNNFTELPLIYSSKIIKFPITVEEFLRYSRDLKHSIPDEDIKKFIDNYSGKTPVRWNIPENEDVSKLDGHLFVVSSDENSIPYDTWDQINETFNGWNIHLG